MLENIFFPQKTTHVAYNISMNYRLCSSYCPRKTSCFDQKERKTSFFFEGKRKTSCYFISLYKIYAQSLDFRVQNIFLKESATYGKCSTIMFF